MRRGHVIAIAALCCGCVSSKDEPPPPSGEAEPVTVEAAEPPRADPEDSAEEQDDAFDSSHAWVSGNVSAAADWIDSFFGNRRHEAEENQTQVRIRLDLDLDEDEDPELEGKVRVRISLPNTDERWQIIIAGNPDENLDGDLDPLAEPDPLLGEPEDERASFGTEYYLLNDLQRNVRFDGSVRIKNDELVYRLGSRYRQNVDLDEWLMRFTERLQWESLDGWDSRTTLDFDRVLSELLFFRATTSLRASEDKDGLRYGQAFSLSHRIAKRKLLSYIWSNELRTEPVHVLDVVRLRLKYRQPVFKAWAFFEVAPEARFRHDEDYEMGWALLFRLDLYFGAAAMGG